MSGKKFKRVATVTVANWCGHPDCKMSGHREWTLMLNQYVVGVTRDGRVADAMEVMAEAYNDSRSKPDTKTTPAG